MVVTVAAGYYIVDLYSDLSVSWPDNSRAYCREAGHEGYYVLSGGVFSLDAGMNLTSAMIIAADILLVDSEDQKPSNATEGTRCYVRSTDSLYIMRTSGWFLITADLSPIYDRLDRVEMALKTLGAEMDIDLEIE